MTNYEQKKILRSVQNMLLSALKADVKENIRFLLISAHIDDLDRKRIITDAINDACDDVFSTGEEVLDLLTEVEKEKFRTAAVKFYMTDGHMKYIIKRILNNNFDIKYDAAEVFADLIIADIDW